jgi:transposase-like protein
MEKVRLECTPPTRHIYRKNKTCCIIKITSKKKKKEGAKTMGIKKGKYSKEQKEEMVQKALSGKSILALGKENNLSPGLINRWRRQYLNGELSNNNDQEVKKLETQVAKLEQMIGKLTMENYILKKEKEYLLQRKKEDSSIITGPYLNPSKRDVG